MTIVEYVKEKYASKSLNDMTRMLHYGAINQNEYDIYVDLWKFSAFRFSLADDNAYIKEYKKRNGEG